MENWANITVPWWYMSVNSTFDLLLVFSRNFILLKWNKQISNWIYGSFWHKIRNLWFRNRGQILHSGTFTPFLSSLPKTFRVWQLDAYLFSAAFANDSCLLFLFRNLPKWHEEKENFRCIASYFWNEIIGELPRYLLFDCLSRTL